DRVGPADAAVGQRRLLVAAQQPRGEAVAPLDLVQERLAVLRVPDGARRDEQRPLRAEPLRGAPVVGEHVVGARDRGRDQAAALLDPFPEPRDPRLAVQLRDASVLRATWIDVRDEEANGVRAQVDGGDAPRHLRGTKAVTRRIEARTSSIAAMSTAS